MAADSSFSQSGPPPEYSPSHAPRAASSASFSVCDIDGNDNVRRKGARYEADAQRVDVQEHHTAEQTHSAVSHTSDAAAE